MSCDQTENGETPITDSLQQPVRTSHKASDGMPASLTNSVETSVTRSSFDSVQTPSTASYERQEREAEDKFNQLIEELCQDLWPLPTSIKHRFLASQAATCLRTNRFFRIFIPAPQLPIIQHLSGGGFNYITSVTLPSSYHDGHRNLILRVPSTVEAADFTCNNAVGKPYVLQHRIPGRDLDSIWDQLSHSQRCVIAKEVGLLIKTLLSVESLVAGTIEAATDGSYTSKMPHVVPLVWTDALGDPIEEVELENAADAENSRPCGNILAFFKYYLSRWKKSALADSLGETNCDVVLYDEMLEVVHEMDVQGLFKPDTNYESIRITGILDWDEAVFAPKIVNCEPPGWLWGYDKETHTENSILPWPYELEGANKMPSTLEQQELKSISDDHAGLEYPRWAYDESSRLVRGLYRIAKLGLTANWYYAAAERIVKEWRELRPTLADQ